AGDVDADGADELMIGAPTATVRDTADAGAVWVVPGSASGLDTDAANALFPSNPDEDARLGASLATVATHVGTPEQRDEPVAGAPGADEVLVFFCTGVGNDTAQSGSTRCIVQP
ncbi:MAG: integrin alpha, partial [Polyangiales bacterium]